MITREQLMDKFSVWLEARTPKVMYHVAPSKARKSIEENGLDYRIHFGDAPRPPKMKGVSYAPRGNYLDEGKSESFHRAMWSTINEKTQCDVWQVNVEGLKLFPDQAWHRGFYCRATIKPDRLKLIFKSEDISLD